MLLFDGFDELVTRVTYDRAADHLETLLGAAEGKAKIVVAQPHPALQVPRPGVHRARRAGGPDPAPPGPRVEDFTPAQIRAYLVNRYGGDERPPTRGCGCSRASATCSASPRTRACSASSPTSPSDRLRTRSPTGTRSARPSSTARSSTPGWPSRSSGPPGARRPGRSAAEELWRRSPRSPCAVGDRRALPAARRTSPRSPTPSPTSPTARLSRRRPRTPSAPAACWSAPTTGSSGSSTPRSWNGWWRTRSPRAPRRGRARGAGPPRRCHQLTVDFLCDLADRRRCQPGPTPVLSPTRRRRGAPGQRLKLSTRLRTPRPTRTCAARRCAARTCRTGTSPGSTSPAPT